MYSYVVSTLTAAGGSVTDSDKQSHGRAEVYKKKKRHGFVSLSLVVYFFFDGDTTASGAEGPLGLS